MSCNLDNDYLQKYIDGELDFVQNLIIEEHIKTCKECQKEVVYIEFLKSSLSEMSNALPNNEISEIVKKLVKIIPQDNSKYKKKSLIDILNLYKDINHASLMYTDYIPGVKNIDKVFKSTLKNTSSIITKAVQNKFNISRKSRYRFVRVFKKKRPQSNKTLLSLNWRSI